MNTWIASRNPAALAEMVTIIETKAPHRIEAAGGDVHYAVWRLFEVERAMPGQGRGVSLR